MSKKTKTTSEDQGTKTYILDLTDGNVRKITVPAGWRVTFGPVVPYAPKSGYNPATALRFYEGSKDNLRACFTDVKAFREAGMQILERRTEVKREIISKQTDEGAKNVAVEARITEWVDPDDVDKANDRAQPFLTSMLLKAGG